MKTSQLFSLAIAFVILSTSAFAGNTKTETKDTSIDSSEELYVNPLEEVLAMQAIPDIILENEMTKTSWLYVNNEEDYVNPFNEVLEMETIPEVHIAEFELLDTLYVNPLQEVLEMEAIPTIKLDSALLARE
jgi:hypothetical protein